MPPPGLSLRTTHQGPEIAQTLLNLKARHIPAAEAADRGCGGHGGARTGLGGADAREGFYRGWRSRALRHLAQARRRRFEQRAVASTTGVGAHRTDPVHLAVAVRPGTP